jgi:transcriptional/translational regulatory protein YebC/TACO1
MFTKKGLITVGTDSADEDELLEIALGAGADDMENTGAIFEITCDTGAYDKLKAALKEKEIAVEVAEISMVPQNTVPVNDEGTAKKVIGMMEAFEDHDDVQNVYANFNIPDEIVARVS